MYITNITENILRYGLSIATQFRSIHNDHWKVQMAIFKASSNLPDATELDAPLKKDPRDVLARLCHDALFKGNARIHMMHPLPLLRVLAHFSQGKSIYGARRLGRIRIQGHERLEERLKTALSILPTVEEKIYAEVKIYIIINHMEYFAVVTDASNEELYGVVRLGILS